MTAFTLSNRMFAVMEFFVDRTVLTLDMIYELDQRPVRAILLRGYIQYNRKQEGFSLTKRGLAEWNRFHGTDVERRDSHAPLARVLQERTGHEGRRQ